MYEKKIAFFFALLMVLSLTIPAGATTTDTVEYAYSLGCDFGINESLVVDLEGDCTIAPAHAATVFGMYGYTSFYNFNADVSYLRGDNPAGIDRLGSSVIFVDGHAAYDNISLGDSNAAGDYRCGIYMREDFTSDRTGYRYAGLASRDLSGVKLYSFIGCSTGQGQSNLCTAAVEGGAVCAVGFTESIDGLSNEGQNWKKAYIDGLGNRFTVTGAIIYATRAFPNVNLGDYVKVFGNPNIGIALNSELGINQTNMLRADMISGSVPTIMLRRSFDFAAVINNVYVNLDDVADDCQGIIDVVKQYDLNFEAKNYKILANEIFDNSGIVKVRYYINGIETSSVFVITVQNGTIIDVSLSHADHLRVSVDETRCISDKDLSRDSLSMLAAVEVPCVAGYNIEKQTGYYYYDYKDLTLYYVADVKVSPEGCTACSMYQVRTEVKFD